MQRVIKTKEPWPPCSPKWDLLLSKPWCTGERAWAERGVGTSSNTDDQRVKKTWKKVIVNQSCPTLYNSMDCSLPGSSVHEITQARILEGAAIPFSRARIKQAQVSCTAGRFFTREAQSEDGERLNTVIHSKVKAIRSRVPVTPAVKLDIDWLLP